MHSPSLTSINYIWYITVISIAFIFNGCDQSINSNVKIADQNLKSENLAEMALSSYEGEKYSDSPVVKNAEKLESKLSKIYDGFGGFWVGDEQTAVTIAIRKDNDFERNRERIITNLQTTITDRITNKFAQTKAELRYNTKEVKFTFKELQHARDLLTPLIHKRDDIVESFIDVKNNVFAIGLINDADLDYYKSLTKKLSINDEIVSFYETTPIEYDNAMNVKYNSYYSTLGLRDYIRPLRGGLQIQGHDPIADPEADETSDCTFGFNAKLDGDDMWLTNSHCTSEDHTPSNTDFYQSIVGGPGTYIGSEFRDYSGTNQARYSDAALIEKSGQTSKFGYILMTEDYESGWGNEADVTLIPDGGNYRDMEIVDEYDVLAPGYGLHRIGRTAGWTGGIVDTDCTTVNIGSWTLYCQIRSRLYAGSGDSGSPVFQVVSIGTPGDHTTVSEVALVGIHWGSHHGNQRTYHSRMDGIRQDLVNSGETFITHN